ncbi:Y-family DNA polymerase [Candidatus Absconditicoccus praedator]|uniref:Y-family DNA polymerase n=1 Tax=Candidatus Absconditicoccus praedator TaxID=2735562 RepID=UPI001E64D302|nr:DNA polymerase IV [Candidatus Absconditicoccus praedator]UFX82631.1 DNA polymerase IV [Candidatus Absconditicoccus praedator]
MIGEKSKQVWALIDCDCFFVSCEVLRNPKLKNKKVCVGKDIVIAKSYEAKHFGVKTGTPIREAKPMLNNEGIFISPDHNFYNKVSKNLQNFLKNFFPKVEVFSNDEAFVDITNSLNIFGAKSYYELAKKIQLQIYKQIGIPVSIGVAPTRILAKTFSPINKPYGVTVGIDENKINKILKKTPIKDIPFIGKSSQEKIDFLKNVFEFKQVNFSTIKKNLQGGGTKIWFEINSVNAISFENNKQAKSIRRTYSFNPHFSSNKQEVYSHLCINIEKAFSQIIEKDLYTKQISIILKDKFFQKYKTTKILNSKTNDKTFIYKTAKNLFDEIFKENIPYRSTGIYLEKLENSNQQPLSIFENNNNDNLWKKINNINKKFGDQKLTSASALSKSTTPKDKDFILYLGEVKA